MRERRVHDVLIVTYYSLPSRFHGRSGAGIASQARLPNDRLKVKGQRVYTLRKKYLNLKAQLSYHSPQQYCATVWVYPRSVIVWDLWHKLPEGRCTGGLCRMRICLDQSGVYGTSFFWHIALYSAQVHNESCASK